MNGRRNHAYKTTEKLVYLDRAVFNSDRDKITKHTHINVRWNCRNRNFGFIYDELDMGHSIPYCEPTFLYFINQKIGMEFLTFNVSLHHPHFSHIRSHGLSCSSANLADCCCDHCRKFDRYRRKFCIEFRSIIRWHTYSSSIFRAKI